MLQIVHLSDIHLGYSDKETAAAKALAAHILGSFPPGTIVLITGDLVQHGSREEYADVCSILAPLRRKFTVITCPGNHDYSDDVFGARLSKESIETYLEFTGDGPFPQAHVVDGNKTVLIGLDSADPDDRAGLMRGWVGNRQLSRMSSLLAEHEDKLRIVYFHHHPFIWRWTMVMLGRTALLKAASAGGASLLLFGHRHWSQEIHRSGIPSMFASGKSTKPRWFKRNLSFRVIEVDKGRLIRVRTEDVA